MAQQHRISAAQLRAARGFLNWSVRELSKRSGVSQSSISRAERAKTGRGMREQNVRALRAAFERFGIAFLGGYGLKWTDIEEQNSMCISEQPAGPQRRLNTRSGAVTGLSSRAGTS
jgi:transcriptional regulator with XRE-family HTH domain